MQRITEQLPKGRTQKTVVREEELPAFDGAAGGVAECQTPLVE